VIRLADLYAVLDGTALIDAVNFKATMASWDYAEVSTKMIFGDSLGDAVADIILRELTIVGELGDTEISKLFHRNASAARLSQAKSVLLSAGLIVRTRAETPGRHRTIWKRLEKAPRIKRKKLLPGCFLTKIFRHFRLFRLVAK
jgi:hypothetical protein